MRHLSWLVTFAIGCAAEPQPAVVLDPTRSYADRLALMAMLESAHPYPGSGTDAWPDHRAGIVLQTEWQLASGRTTRAANGLLDGWWPNVNWTLSVWQFQAQQRFRGEFSGVEVIEPELPRFDMPDSVGRMWADYYAPSTELAKTSRPSGCRHASRASVRASCSA